MEEEFSYIKEAVNNTKKLADKCNLEMDLKGYHIPKYINGTGVTNEEYLKTLCDNGIESLIKDDKKIVRERVEMELSVIKKMGYVDYFLIVCDLVRYAKSRGIPVGPGRGSAAGSMVSYLVGITNINPIEYDLIFERFLNPERIAMPDIDIDFCNERREEVIQYIREKYGTESVAQIITFGAMQAKAVIRDVGRVMDYAYEKVDKLAKMIPNKPGVSLKESMELVPELKMMYEKSPHVKRVIDVAYVLEGGKRHASTHAAGVVIGDKPLVEYLPLFKTKDDQIVTGFTMEGVEKVGLLKMDILGLKTLTIIDKTQKLVRERKDKAFTINNINLKDEKNIQPARGGKKLCNIPARKPGDEKVIK